MPGQVMEGERGKGKETGGKDQEKEVRK